MSLDCRSCRQAAHLLRRMGFRDTIGWSTIPGAPTQLVHAHHANSGTWLERIESEDEFKRRMELPEGKHEPFGRVVKEYRVESLCTTYRSELAWVQLARPMRTTVYMAHPVSGPNFDDNIQRATIWFRHLRRLSASALSELTGVEYELKPLILCPWLAGIEPDEMSPGGREGVLNDCRDTVMLFDEVWMVGGRTEGMLIESSVAPVTRDLTHLGALPHPPQTMGRAINGRAKLTIARKTKKDD